ncbi:MAG: hypothetical protein AMXMBFR13_04050 [Phycisphaerae bacterium]
MASGAGSVQAQRAAVAEGASAGNRRVANRTRTRASTERLNTLVSSGSMVTPGTHQGSPPATGGVGVVDGGVGTGGQVGIEAPGVGSGIDLVDPKIDLDPPKEPKDPSPLSWPIQVKFRDSSMVRLRDGVPTTIRGTALSSQNAGAMLMELSGSEWSRLFSAKEELLDEKRAEAAKLSRKTLPDMNNWFRLRVINKLDARVMMDRLGRLPEVEHVSFVPQPQTPPAIPDFTTAGNASGSYQRYLDDAANGGVDARYAWTLEGGAGQNVTIIDVEYDLDWFHVDLMPFKPFSYIGDMPYNDLDNAAEEARRKHHGTSVMTVMGGSDNHVGMKGIAHQARLRFAAQWTEQQGVNTPDAIMRSTIDSDFGDVIVLEVQVSGPNRFTDSLTDQTGLVPAEWDRPTFDAIRFATALRRIVVEAACNGSTSLRIPALNNNHAPFETDNAGRPLNDSGAIIVGAGLSPYVTDTSGAAGYERQHNPTSNHGPRVDVQGWGDAVVAGGTGDLWNENAQGVYTLFSGTSSATAMIAGVTASLQGIYKYRWSNTLQADEMRDLLKATGMPQRPRWDSPTGAVFYQIGPLPNMKLAADAIWGHLPEPTITPPPVAGEPPISAANPKLLTIDMDASLNPKYVQLYYTIDGSNPGVTSEGTIHGTPINPGDTITLTAPATVKAWIHMPVRSQGGPMRNVWAQSQVHGQVYQPSIPAPVVNIPTGCYPGILSVDLRTGMGDSPYIIYTLDGSEPDENAPNYYPGVPTQVWTNTMSDNGHRLPIFSQTTGQGPVMLRAKNIVYYGSEIGEVAGDELVVIYQQMQPGATTCP